MLGGRRSLQPPHTLIRPHLFHAQRCDQPDSRGAVPARRTTPAVCAERRTPARRARAAHRVRAARRIPDRPGLSGAQGARRAPTCAGTIKGAAGERGVVRPGSQTTASISAASRGGGHVAHGRGVPRYPGRVAPPVPDHGHRGRAGAGAGRGGHRADCRGHPLAERVQARGCHHRREGRRLPGGPLVFQRGNRRAGHCRLGRPGGVGGGPRD